MTTPLPWLIALCVLLVTSPSAWAQRNLPKDAFYATVSEFRYPSIRFDKLTLRLSPGAKIYSPQNFIIQPIAMPVRPSVLFRIDFNGNVSGIWILTAEEAARFKKSAPKPPKPGTAAGGGFKDPPKPATPTSGTAPSP